MLEYQIDWDAARTTMRRAIARQLGSVEPSDLEDLVQEASIRLLRTVRNEGVRNLGALINVVATRTAVDHVRIRVRWRRLFQLLGDEAVEWQRPASAPENPLGDPEERLELIVIEVFQKHRTSCVELARAFFCCRDWITVARDLRLSHDTVRGRWARCLALLRKLCREDPEAGILFAWARE